RYGGLETLAHNFVLELRDKYDITVYNSTKNYLPEERTDSWEGAKIKYIPVKPNGAQSVPYDILSMFHAVTRNDVLLVLGVSGCIVLPLLKLFFRKKKIVVNIDGLEWRRPKWGKFAKAYLKLAEKIAVRYADRIIADNAGIQDYVEAVYKKESDMIAYGGDHAKTAEILPEDLAKYSFLKGNYAVKACRIEPENNIEMILEAFSQNDSISLVILGNWVDSAFGMRMRESYSKYKHIFMLDFIRDARVLDMLRSNAYVYLHGHSAGGTNPSLVEAMNLGLCVVAYGGTEFNINTTEQEALYFKNAEELLSHLENLTTEVREEVGQKMKALAEVRYTWKAISREYSNTLEKALGNPIAFQDQNKEKNQALITSS
ncbi:MAG: DUF1972 domain-containing protein, partial [Bacteroidota bacterium]